MSCIDCSKLKSCGHFNSKCQNIYMYKFTKYEDIPSEEIDDIELVGDDFAPGTYISFTPTFKYMGTVVSWDLRECKDVQARNQGGEQALRIGQGHLLVQLQSSICTTNALLQSHHTCSQRATLGLRELSRAADRQKSEDRSQKMTTQSSSAIPKEAMWSSVTYHYCGLSSFAVRTQR